MLTEICGYLKNWFNRKPDGTDYPKFEGTYSIADGNITTVSGQSIELLDGQYFRIVGSILNEGVFQYKNPQPVLKDETFTGQIWAMAVPTDVIALAKEIEEWNSVNGKAASNALSPFLSESFGGYTYSKSGSGSRSTSGAKIGVTWEDIFGARLTRYKKL